LPDTDFDIDSDDEDEDVEEIVLSAPKPAKKQNPKAASPVRTTVIPPQPTPRPIAPAFVQPPKPKVDVSGVNVWTTVNHKTFGKGEVISIGNDKITVTFEIGEKMFQFPQAFDGGFLRT